MLVHDGSRVGGPRLLRRGARAATGPSASSELVPIPIYFTPDVPQVFHIGAASCGVPGTPAGLVAAAERFGSVPLAELAAPAAALARDGVRVEPRAGVLPRDPGADPHPLRRGGARSTRREGDILGAGDDFVFPELGDALERLGAEGAEPFYRGEIARAIVAEWVRERGGTLGLDDLAAYEPIAREPVEVAFRGRRVLTNPPPSSGGILIAYALALLERLGECGTERIVGGDGGGAGRAQRGLPRRAPRGGLRRPVPRSRADRWAPSEWPSARIRRRAGFAHRRRRARLHDPHHRGRRRRAAAPASPARTGRGRG